MKEKFNEFISIAKILGGYVSDALCSLCDITNIKNLDRPINKEENDNG